MKRFLIRLAILVAILLFAGFVVYAATFEYNLITRSTNDTLSNTHWTSQSFVASSDHTITSTWVNLCRNGSAAEIQVDLFLTDGAHKPTGSALTSSGGVTESTASACTTYSMVNFPVTEYSVTNGTEYAWVYHRTTSGNTYNIGLNQSQYPTGYSFYDNDSGATWTDDQPFDVLFQNDGNESGGGTTTATSTLQFYANPTQDLFNGLLLFFGSFASVIFILTKRKGG